MTKAKTQDAGADKFNLAKMMKARFVGSSREHLAKAAGILIETHKVDDSDSADDIRNALCAHFGFDAPRATPQVPPGERQAADAVAAGASLLPQPKIKGLGKIPNLSSTGRWEGRRRMVQFARANNPEGTITLGWDANQKWTIETPDTVSMPWPYWVRVRDSALVDDRSNRVRKHKKNEEGRAYVETKARKTPIYQFHDLGDEPGTEDLPTSYWDFFRQEGLRTECFKTFGRTALVMIYNKLRDTQTSKFFADKDNMALRRLIAEILDPQLVVLLDEEAYESDAGSAG